MGKKGEVQLLKSDKVKPSHSLVATIKERYPYFIDAVRDIDDAMSMITLYAFLSPEVHADTTIETHHALTSGLHERAKAMVDGWTQYVAKAQVLSKAFISLKGYYYEAIVKGERIRWLCPHEYAHRFPPGIQQYVLISFLEFYLDMMKFILFKLNADLKLELEDREKQEEDGGANTNAEDFQTTADALDVEAKSGVRQQASEKKNRTELIHEELRKVRYLFRPFTFFLSREVPQKHVRLVVEAAGGRVATDYVPSHITHIVIDRPSLPPGMTKEAHIEYVQPQYVFDCLNARAMLPVNGYRIGEELPPHVSPFTVAISNSPEDVAALEEARKAHPRIVSYVPQRVHEIRRTIDPNYVNADPDGKLAALEEELSDEEAHVAVPEMDAADDVALSDDELRTAARRPQWEEEKVREQVQRSALSAFKVKKQRELNLMNAPTDEVVARRRQAQLKKREKAAKEEGRDVRLQRKVAQMKKEEAATRKMQLQVARKKSARYYKMVSGVVRGTEAKTAALERKAKHITEGKIAANKEGTGIVNKKLEGRRQKAEAKGKQLKQKKPANPYKKLPKWVQ
ncbi:pescadillo [Strigomonas culicis]|nr:pescadillo [Strigomonas culicis]|eukprot:EPY37271.1 pescadillo [Strigomonas culicis]